MSRDVISKKVPLYKVAIWTQPGTSINVIYYYVIWTDNGSTIPEANTQRQEGKYPMMKISLCLVNSVLILYRTDNMQSVILLSLVASFFLPPCGLQSTYLMPCYISPYVYNIYGYQYENT